MVEFRILPKEGEETNTKKSKIARLKRATKGLTKYQVPKILINMKKIRKKQSRKKPAKSEKKQKTRPQQFKSKFKWWKRPSIEYAFMAVRDTLEKLMASNVVSLLDKEYIGTLKHRIMENYVETLEKRIQLREEQENNRVRNLVISRKIPFLLAPEGMSDHVVISLENFCNDIIEKRRAKMKIQKSKIHKYLYWDDTTDPPSGLSIENGSIFRKPDENLCVGMTKFLPKKIDEGDREEQEDPYMFSSEDYRKLCYIDFMMRRLYKLKGINAIFDLVDTIIARANVEEQQKHVEEIGQKRVQI